jgi:hypothetical protein
MITVGDKNLFSILLVGMSITFLANLWVAYYVLDDIKKTHIHLKKNIITTIVIISILYLLLYCNVLKI